MAFANIVANDGTTDQTYTLVQPGESRFIYRDLTNSSLALPHTVEISHTPGSNTKPDRHLVRNTRTGTNDNEDRIDSASVHIVIAAPRNGIVPLADVKKMLAELADLITTTAFVDAVLAGSYP